MKKVLFILPSLMRGGAETQAIELINEVDGSRFKKYVCVLSNELDQKDKLDLSNISLCVFERERFFDLAIARKLARYIEDASIDVVHCTLQISLLYAYMASFFTNRKFKIITAIHTTKNVSLKNELIDRVLYRFIMRKSDDIIFVCHAQKDYWIKKYPEMKQKSTVIYNGIDVNKFSKALYTNDILNARKTLQIPVASKVIINIAGFRPEKGHLLLLEAFSKLNNDVHLLLAGDGVLRQAIEKKINTLGMKERVHLLGNVPDVRPYLAISDLSILSSTAVETFSIAMLESMSMEVPMVATDIGGLKEAIIEGVTGNLVQPGNINDLSNKIAECLATDVYLEKMKKKSREMVVGNFTKENMAHETERLFS